MMAVTRNLVTGVPSDSFPGQIEDEKILIFVHRHWMAFIPWAILILIMLAIPSLVLLAIWRAVGAEFLSGMNLVYTGLAVCAFLLVTNAVFLTAWIEHYLDVAIITPERFIHIRQVGLFNRFVAELSLLRVQDVSAKMGGYVQTLFQYGAVVVESAGEEPNFMLPYVPKPHVVANTIMALHDQLARQPSPVRHAEGTAALTDEVVPAMTSASTEVSPAMAIGDELIHEVSGIRPDRSGAHPELREDLIHVAQRNVFAKPGTKRRARPSVSTPSTEQSAKSSKPAGSPNRLPPRGGRGQAEGELSEGETVTLGDDLE